MKISVWTTCGARVIQWNALVDQVAVQRGVERSVVRAKDLGASDDRVRGVLEKLVIFIREGEDVRHETFGWLGFQRQVIEMPPSLKDDAIAKEVFSHLKGRLGW